MAKKKKTAVEILREARDFLSRRGKWTRGTYARVPDTVAEEDGISNNAVWDEAYVATMKARGIEPTACCSLGAIIYFAEETLERGDGEAVRAVQALVEALPMRYTEFIDYDGAQQVIAEYNDYDVRKKRDIINMFDRAIKNLENAQR